MNNAKKQRKTIEWERLETLQENWRYQGTFHARMGTIKDRKRKDITEAEEIKKRWKEYIGELSKKGRNELDNHDGVVTHLEPDILKYEVNWALGSIL